MDIARARKLLASMPATGFDIYEREETGDCQLIVPIVHEDNDMVDIFLQSSPLGEDFVRICDFGMTLMRLSYTFDIKTPTREDIFNSILINNRVANDEGNLYLDTPIETFYQNVIRFAGCIQKICNMRYWGRETIRNAFYDDLDSYIVSEMELFTPTKDKAPLPDYPLISVDWALRHQDHNFYLFGVRGNNKAKTVAISLLEFQKTQSLNYISLIVHENMEELGQREKTYLTKNADKQYPALSDFIENGISDINRLVVHAA